MFSFSYSVTREYPYRWFTPTAIVGSIVLTILFSAINFFSNAYNMVTITTDDPHAVEANRWSGRVPGIFTSKIQPKCQDAIISVGSTVTTNQTALSYQVIADSAERQAALAYHNQPFGNTSCSLVQVSVQFDTVNGRHDLARNWSGWGVSVSATLSCSYLGMVHSVMVLSAQYDPITAADAINYGVNRFIQVNTATPMFVWAETLLMGFWAETVTAITHETAQLDSTDSTLPRFNLSSGVVYFSGAAMPSDTGADIKTLSYFSGGQYAFFDKDSSSYSGEFNTGSNRSLETLISDAVWPNVWAPADRLAKAMSSTVIADFGQASDMAIINDAVIRLDRSMITTSDRLHYWTENLTQIWNANTVKHKDRLLVRPMNSQNPATGQYQLQMAQYNGTDTDTSNLTNSIIAATYTCQVPRLKSGFNIFISILVADLVLLRVVWTLYNYVVCYFLKDRHPDSNLCVGCAEHYQDGDAETGELGIVDTGEDTDCHGQDIEMGDIGRDLEEQTDQQSLQKLLTREPVGS